MADRRVRTTLALPADLLTAVDRVVGERRARSRNEFVASALRRELAARRRAEIDAAFEGMARDEKHRAESERIDAELAPASWEAFQTNERPS